MVENKLRILASCLLSAGVLVVAGCGDDGEGRPPARDVVRRRIEALAPAANLGHRGSGVNRPGQALPENSIASFLAAMADGADGIELDVELSADGALIVMHDDTLDRTTTCGGCVNALSLPEVKECRLLGANREPTAQHPPTLEEAYRALPPDALVNVELKVFEPPCFSEDTGPAALARAAVAAVRALGAADRTLFSSFDLGAAATVKEEGPNLYSALLVLLPGDAEIEAALALGLDAIHPIFLVPAEVVRNLLDVGLQVNVWTVNTVDLMNQNLDKGATAIITDEPALLQQVLAARRG